MSVKRLKTFLRVTNTPKLLFDIFRFNPLCQIPSKLFKRINFNAIHVCRQPAVSHLGRPEEDSNAYALCAQRRTESDDHPTKSHHQKQDVCSVKGWR